MAQNESKSSFPHKPHYSFEVFNISNPNPNSIIPNTDHNVFQSNNSERRLKRMISNRESARRSRMRRKMQIEELQCLVTQLQTTNRQLSEKLIQLLDCNQQIIQENSQLKDKISSLQMLFSDFIVPLRTNASEDHNSSGSGDEIRVLRAQGSSTVPSNIPHY